MFLLLLYFWIFKKKGLQDHILLTAKFLFPGGNHCQLGVSLGTSTRCQPGIGRTKDLLGKTPIRDNEEWVRLQCRKEVSKVLNCNPFPRKCRLGQWGVFETVLCLESCIFQKWACLSVSAVFSHWLGNVALGLTRQWISEHSSWDPLVSCAPYSRQSMTYIVMASVGPFLSACVSSYIITHTYVCMNMYAYLHKCLRFCEWGHTFVLQLAFFTE